MFEAVKAYKWLIIAGLWLASLGGVGYKSWQFSADHQIAGQVKNERLINDAAAAMTLAAGEAIAKIKIKQVTVRQEIEREIVDHPVHGTCDITERMRDLINEALTGRRTDSVSVSGSGAAAGSEPAGARPQARRSGWAVS